jgi:hypothetical protein
MLNKDEGEEIVCVQGGGEGGGLDWIVVLQGCVLLRLL